MLSPSHSVGCVRPIDSRLIQIELSGFSARTTGALTCAQSHPEKQPIPPMSSSFPNSPLLSFRSEDPIAYCTGTTLAAEWVTRSTSSHCGTTISTTASALSQHQIQSVPFTSLSIACSTAARPRSIAGRLTPAIQLPLATLTALLIQSGKMRDRISSKAALIDQQRT